MAKNYTQLSFEQRYQIEALLQTGRSQKEIAQHIGVHQSTICRELRRNSAQWAPQQVVIAPEMPNARRLNAMPTKPKPLNSTFP
jgi:IS30 family transposase